MSIVRYQEKNPDGGKAVESPAVVLREWIVGPGGAAKAARKGITYPSGGAEGEFAQLRVFGEEDRVVVAQKVADGAYTDFVAPVAPEDRLAKREAELAAREQELLAREQRAAKEARDR